MTRTQLRSVTPRFSGQPCRFRDENCLFNSTVFFYLDISVTHGSRRGALNPVVPDLVRLSCHKESALGGSKAFIVKLQLCLIQAWPGLVTETIYYFNGQATYFTTSWPFSWLLCGVYYV
jgi:hypothetical protein